MESFLSMVVLLIGLFSAAHGARAVLRLRACAEETTGSATSGWWPWPAAFPWEASEDAGKAWRKDFGLTFERA